MMAMLLLLWMCLGELGFLYEFRCEDIFDLFLCREAGGVLLHSFTFHLTSGTFISDPAYSLRGCVRICKSPT